MPLVANTVTSNARLRLNAARCVGVMLFLSGCARADDQRTVPPLPTIAVTHVGVIDSEHGRFVPDQTVLIRDGRITAVGPAADVMIPAGADVVDGKNRFLTPGFADMHVHLYTEGDAFTYVANGVTTVRNMAGDTSHLALRARIASGQLVGPRIITAGPVVEGAPLSHPDNVRLESPAAVRPELTRQRAAGYDFVKVYNRLARPVYDSLVAVAGELGLPVAGHVPFAVGLDGALTARQASIEHFRGYIQALLPRSATPPSDASFRDWSVAWTQIDDGRIASLVAQTVAAGVWNVPTFAFTVHELSPAAAHAQLLARTHVRHLSLAGLPTNRATTSYLRAFTEADYVAAQHGLEAQFRLAMALDAAGAKLLVGTDSWLAGYAFVDELELLVRAGLTPARVIRMATLDAARFLGEDAEWGKVVAGQRANLVLLDADPLVDIRNARRVRAVVLNGRLLDHEYHARSIAALRGRRPTSP